MLVTMKALYAFTRLVLHIFWLLLDMLTTRRLSDDQKDLEILLLRHQLRILQRKLPGSQAPRVSQWEKGILAVLAVQFRKYSEGTGHRLDEVVLLFKPDTVLRWHRELVRRKWCAGYRCHPCLRSAVTHSIRPRNFSQLHVSHSHSGR